MLSVLYFLLRITVFLHWCWKCFHLWPGSRQQTGKWRGIAYEVCVCVRTDFCQGLLGLLMQVYQPFLHSHKCKWLYCLKKKKRKTLFYSHTRQMGLVSGCPDKSSRKQEQGEEGWTLTLGWNCGQIRGKSILWPKWIISPGKGSFGNDGLGNWWWNSVPSFDGIFPTATPVWLNFTNLGPKISISCAHDLQPSWM